jgi:hypothetical protein
MSALAAERPAGTGAIGASGQPPLFDPDGREPTLETLIAETWSEIAAGAEAICPICHERMEPSYGAGAAPVGARCRSCGSSIA